MKAYIYLYLHTKKNYFFEKFQFLNKYSLESYYVYWTFLKPVIFYIVLYFLSIKFTNVKSIIFALPFLVYAIKLLSIDNKKIMHFYRNDWISSIGDSDSRFSKILFGNIFIDTFIEDNILLAILFQCIYFNYLIVIKSYIIFMLTYILIFYYYLVMLQANLNIKKIYSLVMYILSGVSLILLSSFILSSFINFILSITNKEDILTNSLSKVNNMLNSYLYLLNKYGSMLLLVLFILNFTNYYWLSLLMNKGKFSVDKRNQNARVNDLFFLKTYYRYQDDGTLNSYSIKKEYSLIAALYSFNFKEYLNTFLVDRPYFMLIGLLIAIKRFNYENSWVFVCILIIIYFYLDIYSGSTSKLFSNLSFSIDYSTIINFNMMGIPLYYLQKSKLKLFRSIRFISFLSYIFLTLCASYIFKIRNDITLILLFIIIIMWQLLPYIFLVNNIIYSRLNYTNLDKYIEDYNVLITNQKDFILVDMFYKGLFILSVLLGLITLMKSNRLLIFVWIAFIILISSLVILFYFMKRINKNILTNISKGDYSVDFAKIFSKE